jgi:hypothetical protein
MNWAQLRQRARLDFPSNETTVSQWNQNNLMQLYEKRMSQDGREIRDEGCFFIGLYALSANLYPEVPLPDANTFWNSIEKISPQILEKDKLNVRFDKIADALDIYRQWGIKPAHVIMNQTGEGWLGGYLPDNEIYKTFLCNLKSINPDLLPKPFSLILKQPGGNNAHYITDDGSKMAGLMKEDYFNNGYQTIAVFEFERIN